MSKPIPVNKNDTVPQMIQDIMSELISAQSALNMLPEPIENPKGEYLSETDHWAKHCMKHLRQLFADLKVVHERAENEGD